MQYEIPFWSPHPKGKAYKQYTFDLPLELKNRAGEVETIVVQGQNYACHFAFKWQFVYDVSKGKNQALQGLVMDEESVLIRTNCVKDIDVGDVVWLKSQANKDGTKYTVVDVRQQWAYCPKMVRTFLNLSLKAIL